MPQRKREHIFYSDSNSNVTYYFNPEGFWDEDYAIR
jgi:hypothetical protein